MRPAHEAPGAGYAFVYLGLVPAEDIFPSFSLGDAINRWSSFSEVRRPLGARHQANRQPANAAGGAPGPRGPVAPPPPVQRWRYWVMALTVVIAALVLFRVDSGGAAPQHFSYTSFVNEVTTNKVATATIGTTGSVSGKLSGGGAYTSQIPIALDDTTLTPLLLAHKVQVTGTSASTTSVTGFVETLVLIGLMVGALVWFARRAASKWAVGSAGSWALAAQRPSSTTKRNQRPVFRTSPVTRAPRLRSWRSWTFQAPSTLRRRW